MKKLRNISAICLAALLMLATPMSASAEEGRYDASYALVGLGTYADMGIYEPGTYIISASHLSDTGSNILDGLSFVCGIPILGDLIPGCQYVSWGESFLRVMPDTRYKFLLTDGETGAWVWEGELTSGKDELYLGDDHSCYRVKMKPANPFVSNFVYLAKK